MGFSLPPEFGEKVNEFVRLVTAFESLIDENDKSAKLRQALVAACCVLHLIDIQQLQLRINEIRAQSVKIANWQSEILGDEHHFEYFLKNVERKILAGIGIDEDAKERILYELKNLRELGVAADPNKIFEQIATSIGNLRKDICSIKDQQIEKDNRRMAHHKLVKAICTVSIVANAVGAVVFPSASAAALAASITLGGVSSSLPEPK